MNKLRVLDLFSGIGGFSLGLERTGGFETVAFCEIEEFPRKVLAKHWPGVPCYHDVRELTAARLAADGISVDAICGGFPCQDISTAGRGAGIAGERSGLWKEYARLIGELRPQFAIMENVSALLGRGLDVVLGDLASIGYDAEWHCIPASAVGAPHRRDRIWIIAHSISQRPAIGTPSSRDRKSVYDREWNSEGQTEGRQIVKPWLSWLGHVADARSGRLQGQGAYRNASNKEAAGEWQAIEPFHGRFGNQWRVEPNVGRVANGVPNRAHRLKALGNAVVPQIPELIGYAILESIKAESEAA